MLRMVRHALHGFEMLRIHARNGIVRKGAHQIAIRPGGQHQAAAIGMHVIASLSRESSKKV
ncbi:hypothetical protein [Synechococcus sp. CS-1328]|uniref:hypothetical protein n=1 Tax=Synechococcus sp. CS-1328 TaxID=2847976 RepID=UPI0037DA26B8